MSRLRSGAIILLMAIPFALYIGWQVQAASRLDLNGNSPPPEKAGPSKDQMAVNKACAEKWSADIKTLESAAFQFREPGPADVVADDECKTLLQSIAARSAELTNLEKFLSDVDSPDYIKTRLSQKYEDWHESKKKQVKSAQNIETWLGNPLDGLDDPRTAPGAVERFQRLLDSYAADPRFADPLKMAEWKLQCRIKIIRTLETLAAEPYKKVINLPLPLPSESASEDVKKALGAPRAIGEQAGALQAERDKARDAGLRLPDRLLAEAAKMQEVAGKWAGRQKLLGLFAEPTLFTRPDGAAEWLQKIQTVYDKTNLAEDRTRLRDKVQEFCEAFLPTKVLLDDQVLWKGKDSPRTAIKIVMPNALKGGALEDEPPLSRDPDGFNEFVAEKKYDGVTGAGIYCKGEPGAFGDLRPTASSKAAKDYLKARTGVLSGTGTLKWSPNSLGELKNKCMSIAEEVNRLKVPDPKAESPRLWDRLQNLADGARACPALFVNRE